MALCTQLGYYDAYYLKALKVRPLIKSDFDRLFGKYEYPSFAHRSNAGIEIGAKSTPLEMYVNDLFTVPVNIAGVTAIPFRRRGRKDYPFHANDRKSI